MPKSAIEVLHTEALRLQAEFDAMAAEHEHSGDQQVKLRQQMLADLTAIENGIQALMAATDNGDTNAATELRAKNVDTLLRFDATTVEYARLRTADIGRLSPLRDTLAAFLKARAQLTALGCAAAETIKCENVAASLEPFAFARTNSPADPGRR